ncbi:unnamed protein product [Arctogadus glacialis]
MATTSGGNCLTLGDRLRGDGPPGADLLEHVNPFLFLIRSVTSTCTMRYHDERSETKNTTSILLHHHLTHDSTIPLILNQHLTTANKTVRHPTPPASHTSLPDVPRQRLMWLISIEPEPSSSPSSLL